ncbi:MAG: FtsX-like permease family protein, partial [Melioribacteraceae bacterium]|nr:FtsX-like permease family protein [Melioribacteraceae bacterium]
DSLQKGAWDYLINNITNYYYGHAQVQSEGYWDNPSINDAFYCSESIEKLISSEPSVSKHSLRLESFALAAVGTKSYGVFVVGTNPDREKEMTALDKKIVKGSYFKEEEISVLISKGVEKTLNASIGDTLILISQGYRGVNAAGKFRVQGVLSMGPPELDTRMVYMPLKTAQQFYGADSLITSISLIMKNQKTAIEQIDKLSENPVLRSYDVKSWEELLPDLVQAKELDRAGNYVVYFILYTVIAFGIFATILMMIKEREYELGIMISVGMKRWLLSMSVWIEIILTCLLGVFAGSLVALPIVTYFYYNPIKMESMAEVYEKYGFEPILPATVDLGIFTTQAIVVFIISIIISLYPVSRIFRLDIVKALKG